MACQSSSVTVEHRRGFTTSPVYPVVPIRPLASFQIARRSTRKTHQEELASTTQGNGRARAFLHPRPPPTLGLSAACSPDGQRG